MNLAKFPEFWQVLTELSSEKFEWFGPSPIEPFNPDADPVPLGESSRDVLGEKALRCVEASERAARGREPMSSLRWRNEMFYKTLQLYADAHAACQIFLDFRESFTFIRFLNDPVTN